ncbi:dual specificity protein phosphatase 8 [Clupea harengus]|uniref:protein-tyrosine-phosphatase n=1 Tax=Clupea harengus TaxID=7950 RepID=A0A6P8FQN5_CLUHA|nr:dual specificity protein phosphatase 8 [Clupea harengus]
MVFHRERDNERPLLSCILPHLYLGAETDVTQESLSARGISYVLSVSRCSPQPTFLPKSQYLRIPIDDSLRDDLLPWIPQALHFIDGAMSLGCSVLVHCAAGISRSPALAVAYIMYRLGMDLDHAYRFVKERRPSISPNFNFLGQLQLFQGTLTPMCPNAHHTAEPSDRALDSLQPFPTSDHTDCISSVLLSTKLNPSAQDTRRGNKEHVQDTKVNTHCEMSHSALAQGQSGSSKDDTAAQSGNKVLTQSKSPEITLALSDKLKSLTLSLQPIEVEAPSEAQQNLQKPTTLQIPSDSVSLSEKRKRLTLALTPVSASLQTPQRGSTECNKRGEPRQVATSSLKLLHKGESGVQHRARKSQRKAEEEKEKPRKASNSRHSNPQRSSSRSVTKRKDREERVVTGLTDAEAKQRVIKCHQGAPELSRPKLESIKEIPSVHMNGSLQKAPPSTAVEAVEGLSGNANLMSPLSLTVNKLLDWGERMLLGVLLGPRIKVGQPALPYRC